MIELSRIKRAGGGVRPFLVLGFWIWGVLGFLLVFADVISAIAMRYATQGVSASTSAFISMEAMLWIGGMVFFALGSAMTRRDLRIVRRSNSDEIAAKSKAALARPWDPGFLRGRREDPLKYKGLNPPPSAHAADDRGTDGSV